MSDDELQEAYAMLNASKVQVLWESQEELRRENTIFEEEKQTLQGQIQTLRRVIKAVEKGRKREL